MTLALDFATRFIIATKRVNDQKLAIKCMTHFTPYPYSPNLSGAATFDNAKENNITQSLTDAMTAIEEAVLLGTSILTSQGKNVDDVIDAARASVVNCSTRMNPNSQLRFKVPYASGHRDLPFER